MDPSLEKTPKESHPNEWQELRGEVRHETAEVLRLTFILLQDAWLLAAGFLVEYANKRWLHSEEPLFQLALALSSALFFSLFAIRSMLHVVKYVRGQIAADAASPMARYLPWLTALIAGGVLAAAIALTYPSFHREGQADDHRQVSRFLLSLPPSDQLRSGAGNPSIAISPDGSRIVYTASHEGHQQLFLRDMDSLEAKPIAGTENGMAPFFSPDGQSIGFFSSDKLLKVSINGGGVVPVCDSLSLYGASWGADGNIYFVPATASGIFKVSAAGGVPQPVTTIDTKRGEASHRSPDVLPGGKALIFATALASGAPNLSQIMMQSLQTGERKMLIQGGTFPHYLPSGHLLFYRDGTMMAVPFDPVRLELKGQPVPVLERVAPSADGFVAHFAVSRNGSMVYLPGSMAGVERTLLWVDRKGAFQPLGAPPRNYTQPALSPDGKQLAIVIEGSNSDIWIYDISRGALTRLTFEGSNLRPLWTPDAKRIVFTSTKSGAPNIFWKPADGAGADEQITNVQNLFRASSLSPDGKLAFYIETDPVNGQGLWSVPLTGDHKPSIFLQTKFNETVPQASPDGHWIAYISNESGQNEIYVRPYPPSAAKYQISTQGGIQPLWSRNGKELFYRSGDKTMAVDIATEPIFKAGTPHLLFEGTFEARAAGFGTNYDVTPDGQHFVMIKSSANGSKTADTGTGASASVQLNVVLNWDEELKKKVPLK